MFISWGFNWDFIYWNKLKIFSKKFSTLINFLIFLTIYDLLHTHTYIKSRFSVTLLCIELNLIAITQTLFIIMLYRINSFAKKSHLIENIIIFYRDKSFRCFRLLSHFLRNNWTYLQLFNPNNYISRIDNEVTKTYIQKMFYGFIYKIFNR